MTDRQADQKWVDDTRAEYLRRARTWGGLCEFMRDLGIKS